MYYNNKALLSIATLTGASLAQTTGSDDGGGASGSATNGPTGGFACTASYASLLAAAPTPTGDLGSSFTSYASSLLASGGTNANPLALATQVCDFSSSLPASLHSDFDAYVTSVASYVSASSDAIDAVITDCVATGSDGAAYTSIVNSFATHTGPLCTGGGGANGTASTGGPSGTGTGTGTDTGNGGSPTPTATGTGNGGGGVGGGGAGTTSNAGGNGGGQSTSTTPTGAAAQPTALFGGVAAAAGLLGVAILL